MGSSGLYIISTPIGNLGDISIRALEVLAEVDVVYSENIRRTSRLLDHYKITTKQATYRDENKKKMIQVILEQLSQGQSIALTSDSGTPLISDPGYKLVRAVIDAGYSVTSVPGPTALISALTVSGLPTDKFSFVGFLPKKGGIRTKTLEDFGALDATLVLYESPARIIRTLEDINSHLGNRYVVVVKELTKLHETVFYGKVKELLSILPEKNLKGEFVILVAKEGFSA